VPLIRFRWNGGLELGPKETLALVVFLIGTGGQLAAWRSMRLDVADALTVQKLQGATLLSHDSRLHVMEERVSSCCPYYAPPMQSVTPKDLAPPGK
jgi:hypothetical protein